MFFSYNDTIRYYDLNFHNLNENFITSDFTLDTCCIIRIYGQLRQYLDRITEES